MESLQGKVRPSRRTAALAVATFAAALGGCGGDDDYKNNPRPPSPINISAAIDDDKVSVSPRRFGSGPIIVIITNQSANSQEITFETADIGAKPAIKQSTGPINPRDTGQIKLDPPQGNYRLTVSDESIRPARISVGPRRRSAQNLVLQP